MDRVRKPTVGLIAGQDGRVVTLFLVSTEEMEQHAGGICNKALEKDWEKGETFKKTTGRRRAGATTI